MKFFMFVFIIILLYLRPIYSFKNSKYTNQVSEHSLRVENTISNTNSTLSKKITQYNQNLNGKLISKHATSTLERIDSNKNEKLYSNLIDTIVPVHYLKYHKISEKTGAINSIVMFIIGIFFALLSLCILVYSEYITVKFTQYLDILENNETSQEVMHAANIDLEKNEAKDKVYVIYGITFL